jgi:hypothetical protein
MESGSKRRSSRVFAVETASRVVEENHASAKVVPCEFAPS